MNKKILSIVALGAVFSFFSCGTKKEAMAPLSQKQMTKTDSAAYAFGILNGKSFAKYIESVDPSFNKDKVIEGFTKSLKGVSDVEFNANEALFKQWAEEKEAKKVEDLKISSQRYLDENRKKEGVKETKSGIQYLVLKDANGEKPTVQDTVVVHYEGKLIDGTVFDSSYKRGEPATFALLDVIPGWTEGICLMPVGSKYQLVIPYKLAYGERGAGGVIPPYSTLIFDVELKGIKKYHEPKTQTSTETKKETKKPLRTKKKNK